MRALARLCVGLTVAGAFSLAVTAHAEGLVYGDPLHPPDYNWNGLYIGANVGANWGTSTAIDPLTTNRFTTAGGDVTAGGNIGYNWHRSIFLYGLEGDVGFLGDNGTGASTLLANTVIKNDGGFFTTLRARGGIVFNESLLYATGGYIGADMGSRVFTTDRTLISSTAGFESGWTVGAGWERMLTPALSVKVEYLHYDLGTDRVAGFCCGGALTRFFDIENSGDLVRVGLNYRFGERLAHVPPPPTK